MFDTGRLEGDASETPRTDPITRLRDAVDTPTDSSTDEELMSAALTLESARRTLDAASVRVLGELDVRSATDLDCGMRTPRWLAHHAELPASTSSSRVRAAQVLRAHLPEVATALDDGRITFDHARVLADAWNPRIADSWPVAAALFSESTNGVVFERWRREVHNAAALLDADGSHDPADDVSRNRLSKADTIDETYVLKATLVGPDGLMVHQTIDKVADQLFHRHLTDETLSPVELRMPNRSTLEALALAEICRRAMATDLDSSEAPRADITVVINAADPEVIHSPDGTRLADGSSRFLLCDPRLRPIVTTKLSVPLDMGRDARFATPGQRRAMAQRDGGCVFAGCTSPPSWTEAHHIDEWGEGGCSDVRRLGSLCRHHHRVVHRYGWHMHPEPDGTFWFTTPAGRSFWGQQHGHQTRGPTPDSS